MSLQALVELVMGGGGKENRDRKKRRQDTRTETHV
jgi:hypothetical protein